jgi:hypothetical protein
MAMAGEGEKIWKKSKMSLEGKGRKEEEPFSRYIYSHPFPFLTSIFYPPIMKRLLERAKKERSIRM